MNKLIHGVGVNDLGYRVHAQEELPKMEAKESRSLFFYANTMQYGET